MFVIITGSSRGIGLELAKQFLSFGDDVLIYSRFAKNIDELVINLSNEYPGKVIGKTCDVTDSKNAKNYRSS